MVYSNAAPGFCLSPTATEAALEARQVTSQDLLKFDAESEAKQALAGLTWQVIQTLCPGFFDELESV